MSRFRFLLLQSLRLLGLLTFSQGGLPEGAVIPLSTWRGQPSRQVPESCRKSQGKGHSPMGTPEPRPEKAVRPSHLGGKHMVSKGP